MLVFSIPVIGRGVNVVAGAGPWRRSHRVPASLAVFHQSQVGLSICNSVLSGAETDSAFGPVRHQLRLRS